MGLGLAAMGTGREDIYEQIKQHLYQDDAITGLLYFIFAFYYNATLCLQLFISSTYLPPKKFYLKKLLITVFLIC